MEQQFHIGQIARFFDLPASTLRYWDEVGILTPHKNHTNSYREYTVSDLMTISDIIFYKNLGIPLQQSGAMEQAEPEEHTLLLCGKIEELERQQLEIAQRIQKLHNPSQPLRRWASSVSVRSLRLKSIPTASSPLT